MTNPHDDLAALGATHQRPGTVIGGGYKILELLGEGGMGAIYVAEQLSIGRRRALKLMQPHLVGADRMRERFTQEARIGSRIDSEHVVEVIDAGVDAELNVPWIAMELLEGETLADRLEDGPIAFDEATRILTEVCHAVGAAHRANIVHRDLKPENVFLAKTRLAGIGHTVKVLDFGIAKLVSESAIAATQAIGTPLYMPPEQMENGGHITPAADVWSLALIAFYMLTGKPYWRAGNVEDATPLMILSEIGQEPIAPPSTRAAELGVAHLVPAGFDAWFLRAVDRRIEARPRDAGALAEAWRAVEAPRAPSAGLAALNRTVDASPMDLRALDDTFRPDAAATDASAGADDAPASAPKRKKKKKKRSAPLPDDPVEASVLSDEPRFAAPVIPPWQPPATEKKPLNVTMLIPLGLLAIALVVAIARC
ncbi:MAG: serine/threonine-protein kinase [Polyangiaceae bacterium]